MKLSNHLKAVFVILAIIFSISQLADAQIFGVIVDPELEWQTLETEHFRVHFHQGLDGLAGYVAQISEDAYGVIYEEFGQAPDKFDVIILDAFDFSNGSANFLTNTVTLIPSQYRLSDWANVRLDSWWNMLIFHEMVHAIELDMTMGINSVLRSIFGKAVFPNASKPVPFIEGLAVYQKYKHKGESRLNDSRTRMIIREMVLNNEVPDFEDIKGIYNSTSWPQPGFLVYNFGSWLMRYIEETYGEDGTRRFNEANSASLSGLVLFNDLDAITEKAFEVSADELYDGFRAWLKAEFEAEMLEIQNLPLTKAVQISKTGFVTGQPSWSPDGEWIAYVQSGVGRQGLRLIKPNGEEDHEIANGAGLAYPDWYPVTVTTDGNGEEHARLLYTKAEAKGPYYILRDLYEYNMTTEREERLTTDARAYFARYSPDGQSVYYAKNHGWDGSTALARLDLESRESESILEFDEGSGIIHSFSISPDGSQIALAIWRYGGFQDLYLMPIEGGELTPVTQNKNQASDPVWTPDGAYILYSADPDRRYNLYAYEISTGRFYQLTNMVTGAFYPTPSPDSSEIAFGGYKGTGYDVFKIPFEPESWTSYEPESETRPEWPGYPPRTMEFRPYNSFSHLMPKGWIPFPIENGLGLLTFGADPLFTHLYQLILGWDFEHDSLYYNLSYGLTMGLPINIILDGGATSHTESVSVSVPLALSLSGASQAMNVGYTRETESEILKEGNDEPTVLDVPRVTNRVNTNYTYSTTDREDFFGKSTTLSATIGLWNTNENSTWKKRFVVDWTESLRLPVLRTHTFSTRFAAGWTDAESDDEKFSLGASLQEFFLLPDTYTLRGFPEDAFTGTQFALASVQQNFTLLEIERGIAQYPLFIDDRSLSIFLDTGMAGDTLNLKNLAFGYGAEMGIGITAAYGFGFELILGMAQGVGEDSPQFYVSLGI